MAMRMLMLTMMAPTKTTQKTVPPGASNCLDTESQSSVTVRSKVVTKAT